MKVIASVLDGSEGILPQSELSQIVAKGEFTKRRVYSLNSK